MNLVQLSLIVSTLSLFISLFVLFVQERERFGVYYEKYFVGGFNARNRLYLHNYGKTPLLILGIAYGGKEINMETPRMLLPGDRILFHELDGFALFLDGKFSVSYRLFGIIRWKESCSAWKQKDFGGII
jgi:hypothetical protein